MKIYRNGMEIELTRREIADAWHEHQAYLDDNEKDGIKWIVVDKLHKGNFDYDPEDENEIAEEMTDSIWSDVKNRGVDMAWALGTEEYCAGGDGFSEYFSEAMSDLELISLTGKKSGLKVYTCEGEEDYTKHVIGDLIIVASNYDEAEEIAREYLNECFCNCYTFEVLEDESKDPVDYECKKGVYED